MSEREEDRELQRYALDRYDEGLRFLEAENFDLALERFQSSIEIDPRPAAYFQMGKTRQLLGEQEESAYAFAKALDLAPDYQDARFALIELDYEPPSEADMVADSTLMPAFIAELEEEIELRLIEFDVELAGLEREELLQRIRERREVATSQRLPTESEVHAVLFSPYTTGEESMPSATDPTYASDRDIILNTYPYHFANGKRFQENQQYEKAADEYRLAIQYDPSEIEARLNLGDVMLRLEREPQAQFHYLTAMEQFPQSARPHFKMGNYYETLARPELARSYYEEALVKDPAYVEPLNNLAALEIREKNFTKAVEYLKQATRVAPTYPLAYLNLGVVYENQGNVDAALEAYERYVELGGSQASEVRIWIQELTQ